MKRKKRILLILVPIFLFFILFLMFYNNLFCPRFKEAGYSVFVDGIERGDIKVNKLDESKLLILVPSARYLNEIEDIYLDLELQKVAKGNLLVYKPIDSLGFALMNSDVLSDDPSNFIYYDADVKVDAEKIEIFIKGDFGHSGCETCFAQYSRLLQKIYVLRKKAGFALAHGVK
ncbi:MAG: hypothetical protein JEZ07_04905 [Phycisphaerae bacterium]|nr:hypothetical protein [Phycisphaerae bacterium]